MHDFLAMRWCPSEGTRTSDGRGTCKRDACHGVLGMSHRKRQPHLDQDRKARFREMARGIVFKDRDDRKYKRPVDTAGTIARALERAWRDGFAAARDGDDVAPPMLSATGDEAIPWHRIPPRPRTAFWSICSWFVGKNVIHTDRGSMLVPGITSRGTPGWTLIRDPTRTDNYTLGDRTILPLIRLGLLEQSPDTDRRLLLTARGRATWSASSSPGAASTRKTSPICDKAAAHDGAIAVDENLVHLSACHPLWCEAVWEG